MIELIDNENIYLYGDTKAYEHFLDFKINNTEIVNNISVHSISQICDKQPVIHFSPSYSDYKIFCHHNEKFNYLSSNSLPSEGWEELIECWSCHNNEFKSVLNLKIKPRINGILVSHLYFIINKSNIPKCCNKDYEEVEKIFFNEVKVDGYTNEMFLYKFLTEHFKMNSLFLYTFEGKNYEMFIFCNCTCFYVKNSKYYKSKAIKIGIKQTEKKFKQKESINNYFLNLIHNKSFKLGIEILGYKVGFILENNNYE